MSVYEKISDTVYFIHGPRFDSNSILVTDVPFLVDTGTGFYFSELAVQMNKIGVRPNELKAIVNTHCHFDHTGGNHYFACDKFIHGNDLEHLNNADHHILADFFSAEPAKQSAKQLDKEFHGWDVIHTPGHTPGSVCLLKDGILISGDTKFARGYGRTDLAGGNQEQLEESIKLIDSLEYNILLPGHGNTRKKF